MWLLFKQDYVWDILQIDSIIPLSKGSTDDETNLWIVCGTCNRAKSDKTEAFDQETNTNVTLFNPRLQNWFEHFVWRVDGTMIVGKTSIGRATILALNLNKDQFVKVWRNWTAVGWHPPQE